MVDPCRNAGPGLGGCSRRDTRGRGRISVGWPTSNTCVIRAIALVEAGSVEEALVVLLSNTRIDVCLGRQSARELNGNALSIWLQMNTIPMSDA